MDFRGERQAMCARNSGKTNVQRGINVYDCAYRWCDWSENV